ncbi:uncharacterized protein LOC132386548 [Hypanus sabinus]|uniref:uncharacterized protein LOC132386548 n=1 Tax=Hypanus sabinus TaxID=79690 RepID=UPI0028C3E9BC|nr:uncharacterized protein LOC132386548 [Hypanus sabinus]
MDKSETFKKKQLAKPDSLSPSGAKPDVSYVELHFKSLSVPRVRTNGDGLISTYTEVNFRRDDPFIDEDEDAHITSGPRGMPTTAQTAAHVQQSKVKIGNRPYRLICLLCLVTAALIVTVAGLLIHGMHSDLRHRFTEMETKYRSVNETKAEICDFLTSRREQACSKDFVTNTDRRYYVSKFATSFLKAMQECSKRESSLLEINSRDEASFVICSLIRRNVTYWIRQCETGDDATGLLYNVSSGRSSCSACASSGGSDNCLHENHHFICEYSAPCWPDIPEEIQLLCQQPGQPT